MCHRPAARSRVLPVSIPEKSVSVYMDKTPSARTVGEGDDL